RRIAGQVWIEIFHHHTRLRAAKYPDPVRGFRTLLPTFVRAATALPGKPPRHCASQGHTMIGTGIRTAAVAVAAALGLGLAPGTAQAGPYPPSPPEARATLYGDPAAAVRFWRHQEYDDDCVPMAVADVVGELTGVQPTEEAVVAVAHASPSTVHKGPMYTKPVKNQPGQGTSF